MSNINFIQLGRIVFVRRLVISNKSNLLRRNAVTLKYFFFLGNSSIATLNSKSQDLIGTDTLLLGGNNNSNMLDNHKLPGRNLGYSLY